MDAILVATYRVYAQKRSKLIKKRRWATDHYNAELAAYQAQEGRILANPDPSGDDLEFLGGWESVLEKLNPDPPLPL